MEKFKYDLIEHCGVISDEDACWKKELTLVSWNAREPKYDIRDWSPDYEKMGRGVTFTKEELLRLRDILNKMDFDSGGQKQMKKK